MSRLVRNMMVTSGHNRKLSSSGLFRAGEKKKKERWRDGFHTTRVQIYFRKKFLKLKKKKVFVMI